MVNYTELQVGHGGTMLVTYCFEAPSLQVTLSQQVQVSLECHGMPWNAMECHVRYELQRS